ncbi:MutS-related protein [Clostridium botulinum]|uniref:DNA mismatch repair protein MutS n=1 Tax=Clostridium botulinum TaxID=1491 RepID=A0A9Q1ZC48_CLOBO|nr:DNA mismatch repair protein MutS [Clostridium botulinum]AEB76541.1 mismatch repair protein MutS-like protein [Clostridium botulinum BKT015925]KEH97434.1 DNA mismatch repair protein MutS [Clostridium botulinum D str. 16868]KEI04048.1 DNA mismatch repair protein MutS [Clostridium botulinum C/D str. Sp77]KLU76078.1 DNA mismatch repair protein MutS [Clostridium botulinum V891]KOA74252.1 DNA mismatch repair protein MutS [Clostridium botulinum]
MLITKHIKSYFNKRNLKFIRSTYGKPIKRKRNLDKIKSFFNYIHNASDGIDDITWADLNMDDMFCQIDRTFSNPGEQVLYKILRTPTTDESLLKKRDTIIDFFQNNKNIRENISLSLHKLGKTNAYIDTILFKKIIKHPYLKSISYICSISFAISLIMCSIIGFLKTSLVILLLSFFNMYIHYKLDRIIKEEVLSVVYFGNAISTSANICTLNCPELQDYANKLIPLIKKLNTIRKNTLIINRLDSVDLFGDYINILFLIKEISYFKSIDTIIKYKKELLELYLTLGEIDALISIASYRDGLNKYIQPSLTHKGKLLYTTNLIHPLIKNPVPNSISINNHGILITGSNMSGKSTFLRTVGANAILAQTIYTCLADSYSSSFFNIVTSIKPGDDLLGGKSYYLAEAEALLRIINSSKEKIPCLCMIDEIYRGTNPIERISASCEILNYLSNHNALAIVATHDLQLTTMSTGYKCYYFKEDVTNTGLTFDYTIKEGISPTRNAVKILKFLGYPTEILKKTEERIKAIE